MSASWEESWTNISTYSGPTFREGRIIPTIHSAPRYGHTKDWTVYINGTPREQVRYKVGFFGNAILLWCFFFVWACFVVYFKRTNKFGWLVSKRPPYPEEGGSTLELREEAEANAEQSFATDVGKIDTESVLVSANDVEGEEETEIELAQGIAASHMGEKSNGDGGDDDGVPKDDAAHEREGEKRKCCGDDDEEYIENELTVETWAEQVKKADRRIRRTRITVLACCALIFVMSGLLIGLGFDTLDQTLHSALDNVPPLQKAIESANNATTAYMVASNATRDARNEFFNNFNSYFCPDFDFTNYTNLEDAGTLANRALNRTQRFIVENIAVIDEGLYNVSTSLLSVQNTLEAIEPWWYAAASSFVLLVDAFVLVFAIGVVVAWIKNQPTIFWDVSTTCILPIFILLVVLLWIIAPICLSYSEFAADLCIDSPDEQIVRLFDPAPAFQGLVEYVVRGCDESLRPDYLIKFFDILESALEAVNEFLLELIKTPVPLVAQCGGTDSAWETLILASTFLQENIEIAVEALEDVLFLLQCPVLNALYHPLAYETGCDHGMAALAQLYFYLFAISLGSAVIVTLRVAWYDSDDPTERNAFCNCRKMFASSRSRCTKRY